MSEAEGVGMFVQVIRGHVSDAAQVRAQLDKWQSEVAPGAEGWLGSTSGVTDDGEVVALVRFKSAEAASQNSDRPEQGTWWQEMARLFTDEPVFHNSTSVEVDTPGDPSQAGFVQVMQGRSSGRCCIGRSYGIAERSPAGESDGERQLIERRREPVLD